MNNYFGQKTSTKTNLNKYYITQYGSQLSLNASSYGTETEYSGATFDIDFETPTESQNRTGSGVTDVYPTNVATPYNTLQAKPIVKTGL